MAEVLSQEEGTAALFKRVCGPLAPWTRLPSNVNQEMQTRLERAQANHPDATLWGTPQETRWYACTIAPSFQKRIPDLDRAIADVQAQFKTHGTGGVEDLVVLKRLGLPDWDVTFLLPVKALEFSPSKPRIDRTKFAALYEQVTGEQPSIPQPVVMAGEVKQQITPAVRQL